MIEDANPRPDDVCEIDGEPVNEVSTYVQSLDYKFIKLTLTYNNIDLNCGKSDW